MFDKLRNIFDIDDLIFENRNKAYGAYQLRKRYNRVVIAGIIIGCSLTSFLVILPFVLRPRDEKVHSGDIAYFPVQMESLEPPIDRIIVPPAPPPPGSEHVQEVVKYVPPVVVDTIMPDEPKPVTTDEVLAQTTVDQSVIDGFGAGDDLSGGQDGVATDDPFFLVEVMPSFKGGDINKFREWVQRRTNYPQAAIDAKIQGKVFLTFIIEPDGTVSNVTVVKGVASIIDNEAVKAIQASPKWSPGLQRGQPVRVRYSMWLNFIF
jgi:periplasmic protein TonB